MPRDGSKDQSILAWDNHPANCPGESNGKTEDRMNLDSAEEGHWGWCQPGQTGCGAQIRRTSSRAAERSGSMRSVPGWRALIQSIGDPSAGRKFTKGVVKVD